MRMFHGEQPADPLTLATWLNVIAEAGINVARAAVIDRLRADGHAFDARNDDLRRVTSGIKRTFAAPQRTVLPNERADVQIRAHGSTIAVAAIKH